jgi:hypothetical protein
VIQAILARFPGARLLSKAEVEASDAAIAEARRNARPPDFGFRVFGPRLASAGWHVIPQSRTGRRLGSIIKGRSLEWKPYQTVAPDPCDVKIWSEVAAGDNTAMILGNGATAAARIRVIDIDMSNSFWAAQIRNLAILHLGYTPLQRQGRAPRWALFYREAVETPVEETIRSRSFTFEEQSEEAVALGSHDGLEILSAGRMITIHGTHHKTGAAFTYADKSPLMVAPEELPVIDQHMIDAFLKAVHQLLRIKGFERRVVDSFERETVEYDPNLRIVVPPYKARKGVWQKVGGSNSIIVDDRKGWCLDRTLAWVCYNADHIRAGGPGLAQIRERCLDEALRHIARTGDWSSDTGVTRHVVELFDRTARRFCDGEFPKRTIYLSDTGEAYTRPEAMLAIQSSLGADGAYIKPANKRRRSPTAIVSATAPNAEMAASRAILGEAQRIELGKDISRRVQESIMNFLAPIWDARDARKSNEAIREEVARALTAIHLLKAPTGAGKTTTLIRCIADVIAKRGPLGMAIGIAMPSHANAAEGLNVAVERATAEEIDATWDEALKAAAGMRSMIWKGKVLAGCLMSEQMQALYQASVPASGLCGTKVPQLGGGGEFVACQFAGMCGPMKQLELAAQADIIFMPHAYLTVSLPRQLKEAIAGLVIDESFWTNIVRTAVLPVDILRRARKAPKPTKMEAKIGFTGEDLLRGRDEAATIVLQSLYAGKCPAQTLYQYTGKGNGGPYRGIAIVQDAITICGRGDHTGLDVRPGMSMEQVEAVVAEPLGENIRLEKRFWMTVAERIRALEMDDALRLKAKKDEEQFDERTRRAKHDGDRRIQLVQNSDAVPGKSDGIRLSWRVDMNWSDVPLLLLDASADESILTALFPDREFETTRIDEPLHLRTVVVPEVFSDLSLLAGGRHLDEESRYRAAERLAKVQALIGRLAALYGWSRMLVAATKAVRVEMCMYWPGPENCDFLHFGNTRGFDFAKRHMCALSVGRLEPPVAVLDGYVGFFASLSNDDELPWDEEGTGYSGGKRLEAPKGERVLQMRHGGEITVRTSVYGEGYPWHARIQKQFREEELRQFVGRLRPVYRTEPLPPIWFCLSSAVPEGIIVDDIVNLDDILSQDVMGTELLETVHRLHGVLDPEAAPAVAHDLLNASSDIMMQYTMHTMTEREVSSMSRASVWEDGLPQPRTVYLMPWVKDVDWALSNSSTIAGHCLDRYVVELNVSADTDCVAKMPDKVDRMMSARGPEATMAELREERRARDIEWREYAIQRWGRGVQTPPPGARKALTLTVLIILEQAGVIKTVEPDVPVPIPEAVAA